MDNRFVYHKMVKNVSSERLNQLADFVFGTVPTSTFQSIVSSIKLIVAVAYVIALEKIIAAENEIKKQEYQQQQINNNQSDIDNDDLGSTPR